MATQADKLPGTNQHSKEWLKRMGAQVASQLPDDRRDALVVLNYAREILLNLGAGWEIPSPTPQQAKPAIRLVSNATRPDRAAN